MNDYKELIKALRDSAWLNEISEHKPVAKNLRDAADAIEQLGKDNAVLTKERNAAFKCIEDIESVLEYGYATDIGKVIREWKGR